MISQGMIFETKYVDVTELKNAISGGTSGQNSPPAGAKSTDSATPPVAAVTTKSPTETTEEKAKEPVTVDEQPLANLVPLLIWQAQKDDDRTKASTLNAQEGFMIWIKASFVVGALLSAPWVFYQLWMFVASGLYRHERSYVYTFLPISLGLFFLGAARAYWFVFQPVLKFFFD